MIISQGYSIKVMVETTPKKPKLYKEFEYYVKHQEALVQKYEGRYLVIIGQEVVGDYDTRMKAYWASLEKYPLGAFMIQLCMPGEDNYRKTFHNHVKV